MHWQKRNPYSILVGKQKEKMPLGIPRRRWEDSIKIDLYEIEWGGIGWIDPAEARDRWKALVNMVMNLRFYKTLEYS
jgi:hypothetical protein